MEEVQFTEKETRILIAAITEVEMANSNFQQAQLQLHNARKEVDTRSRIAESTYKTIMVLKDVNPDAYELEWDKAVTKLQLKLKPPPEPEKIKSEEVPAENMIELPSK